MSLSYMSQALHLLAERRDLDSAVTRGAMNELMDGCAVEAQIGAFLMGLRAKGETVEEITAFAQVMREKSIRIRPRVPTGKLLTDVCGTGGAKRKTLNVSTIAAFVVAGAGVPIAKHGNRGVTHPCGSADLLQALGVNLEAPPETVSDCIEEIGIGFLFAPVFHPAMRHAAPVRRVLGVRTVFNVLGPLINPAGAQAQLIGVFDPKLIKIYPQVLRALGLKRVLVAHGTDGLDELSTVGPTQVAELHEGKIQHYEIRPEAFGFRRTTPERIQALSPRESAALALELLKNHLNDERYELLLLNAGAGIYVGNGASSIDEGLAHAEESVKSGSAYEKLKLLIERTGTKAWIT